MCESAHPDVCGRCEAPRLTPRATGERKCIAVRPPRGSRGQPQGARTGWLGQAGERGPCEARTEAEQSEMVELYIITLPPEEYTTPPSCGAGRSGVCAGAVRGVLEELVRKRTPRRLWEMRGAAADAPGDGRAEVHCSASATRQPRQTAARTHWMAGAGVGAGAVRGAHRSRALRDGRVVHHHLAAGRREHTAARLRSGRERRWARRLMACV